MIYSAFLYLVLILPFSIRKYMKDGKRLLFVKILNSLLSLFVFVALTGILKIVLPWNEDSRFMILEGVPSTISIVFSCIYVATVFYSLFLSVLLALINKGARLSFIRIIPLLIVLISIHKYYLYTFSYDKNPSMIFVLISTIQNLVIWGGIILFYINKKTKEFFANV